MNYQKLRELRNQLLHDGTPPLEFGCEYIGIGVEYDSDGDPYPVQEQCVVTFTKPNNSEIDEILGTPVTIAEVLVMLGHRYSISGDGTLWEYDLIRRWETEGLNLDITLPLSEQEEACGKLLELLSNK